MTDCRPGLFITGTDTDVGKTFVTAAVVRLLRRQGRPVRVCKPVATGAFRAGDRWRCDDTTILAQAAGLEDKPEQVTAYCLPEPVAPPIAARRQGIHLTLPAVAAAVAERRRPGAALFVEGVGGLLCPLTEEETIADLAAEVRLPLVVVARRSLGTLNHTLLTLEVARTRGLHVAGVIVSEVTPPAGLAEETNVEELRRRLAVPLLAVVGHGDETALAAVDWWHLCVGGS